MAAPQAEAHEVTTGAAEAATDAAVAVATEVVVTDAAVVEATVVVEAAKEAATAEEIHEAATEEAVAATDAAVAVAPVADSVVDGPEAIAVAVSVVVSVVAAKEAAKARVAAVEEGVGRRDAGQIMLIEGRRITHSSDATTEIRGSARSRCSTLRQSFRLSRLSVCHNRGMVASRCFAASYEI